MAPPICSWSFLSSPETVPPGPKSFAQAVSAAGEDSLPSLPPKIIVGDTVRIKITQREYEAELSKCLRNRIQSHYARILVDVDMFGKFFDSVVVEREGYVFPVTVEYERRPSFFSHCKMLGHSIQHCNRINNAQSYVAPRNH